MDALEIILLTIALIESHVALILVLLVRKDRPTQLILSNEPEESEPMSSPLPRRESWEEYAKDFNNYAS